MRSFWFASRSIRGMSDAAQTPAASPSVRGKLPIKLPSSFANSVRTPLRSLSRETDRNGCSFGRRTTARAGRRSSPRSRTACSNRSRPSSFYKIGCRRNEMEHSSRPPSSLDSLAVSQEPSHKVSALIIANSDDGSGLQRGFQALLLQSRAESQARLKVASTIEASCIEPFSRWHSGHKDRVSNSKNAVGKLLQQYETQLGRVQGLKSQSSSFLCGIALHLMRFVSFLRFCEKSSGRCGRRSDLPLRRERIHAHQAATSSFRRRGRSDRHRLGFRRNDSIPLSRLD